MYTQETVSNIVDVIMENNNVNLQSPADIMALRKAIAESIYATMISDEYIAFLKEALNK